MEEPRSSRLQTAQNTYKVPSPLLLLIGCYSGLLSRGLDWKKGSLPLPEPISTSRWSCNLSGKGLMLLLLWTRDASVPSFSFKQRNNQCRKPLSPTQHWPCLFHTTNLQITIGYSRLLTEEAEAGTPSQEAYMPNLLEQGHFRAFLCKASASNIHHTQQLRLVTDSGALTTSQPLLPPCLSPRIW
uniref:Uncharacterized protein n=1 Tax=Fagus sylvatica TaxID=28930 RepID=A0A2N9G4V2_FAGSY